ncbi:MAG TPA: tyrosine-type recombinase/integrase, partial [Gaiellaceae bacterium]|nr:tyrosine-type recombinase/integrase [Gaiellaceae bacterium]
VIHVRRAYDDDEHVFGEPKSEAGLRRVPIAGVLRDYLLAWKLASTPGAELVLPRDDGRPFNASAARSRALRAWAAVGDRQCAAVTRAGEPCKALALRGYTFCGRHKAQEPAGAKPRKPTVEPIGLHEARHTFASLMIAAGVNAKALSVFMGHSSIQVTYDRYGHLMPGGEDEAAALLNVYLEAANTQARLAQLDDERAPVARQSDTETGGSQRVGAGCGDGRVDG